MSVIREGEDLILQLRYTECGCACFRCQDSCGPLGWSTCFLDNVEYVGAFLFQICV